MPGARGLESERTKANRALLTEIRAIYAKSRRTYGSPSIFNTLRWSSGEREARGEADA